jgi:hypothetical protein
VFVLSSAALTHIESAHPLDIYVFSGMRIRRVQMRKRYYRIGEANEILMDRFGYCKRTVQAIRNDPKYGFPKPVGPTKRHYHADQYDKAVDDYEKRFFGR